MCEEETRRRQAGDILRRGALALLLGMLVLTTLRVAEPATTAAGDQAHATVVAAVRTHGTPASPLVALLSIAAGLAAILLWRSSVPATPATAYIPPRLPIRRRGPPSSRAD